MKEFVAYLVAWGPLGVFVLSALDSAGIPLPSGVDALLVAVVISDPTVAVFTVAAAIAGSLIGNVVLYHIARKGGQLYLDKLTSKGRGKRFRQWFDKYGLVTVFVPAVSVFPMPLKFFVVSAAVFGVPLLRFLAVILVARAIRYGLVAWLAASYGQQALQFTLQNKWWFLLGAAVLGLVFFGISRMMLKDSATNPAEEASA